MADLLELSARIIDSGVVSEPVNRTTQQLSELADDVAIVESFSHAVALRTDEGLVVADASSAHTGVAVVAALRGWSTDPVHTLVYTHGHLDHVGGGAAVLADAAARGHRRPVVVGHANVPVRFERYAATSGYNSAANARQFNWQRNTDMRLGEQGFLPEDLVWPTETYTATHTRTIGGLAVELHHAKGETDDHTWVWVPERRLAMVGDMIIWNFPNAGNPQKVQRFPEEWAAALRAIAALEPELMVPAHGLPVAGVERVRRVLETTAGVLETLVADVVAMMNAGCTLDEIVHTVRVPAETLATPFLRPLYDEPEFVVRNVWRRYGGWWDGNPAHLKPAPDDALAAELASLAGGARALAMRALELADAGDLRLAVHLVEYAGRAAPADPEVHAVRADVYERQRKASTSLMARGIYAGAVGASRRVVDAPPG